MSDQFDCESEESKRFDLLPTAASEPVFAKGTVNATPVEAETHTSSGMEIKGTGPDSEGEKYVWEDGGPVSHGSQLIVGSGFLSRMSRKRRQQYLDKALADQAYEEGCVRRPSDRPATPVSFRLN